MLSRSLPKVENPTLDNQIVTSYGLIGEQQTQNVNQMVIYEHKDEDCPNTEQVKKLKAEIKRLRQELILKPSQKKNPDEEDFTEEEKQALKMLNAEQRKFLTELEQAGCNKEYLKKKIRQMILNQD